MKRTTFITLGLLLGSLLVPTLPAQTPPALPTNVPGGRPLVRDRVEALASSLKLTDEQKEKVRPVLDAETKQIGELLKQADVSSADKRAKRMVIRQETNAKLKGILTPEQYERYTKPLQARPMSPGIGNNPNPPPAAPTPPAVPAK